MKCPYCSNIDSKQLESRSGDRKGNTIRRVRECLNCSERFITFEYVEQMKTPTPSEMFNLLFEIDKNLEEMQKKMDETSKFSKELNENFQYILSKKIK